VPRTPAVAEPTAARSHAPAAGRAGTPAEGRELRARGQRTVRKLLDAGIDVFGKKGYHPSRVDDIVKVAKTSHGTFYLYFANKEDLFRALTLDVSDEIAELVASLAPLTPDARGYAALRAWLADFTDIHGRYGSVIKAWTEAEIDDSDFGRLGNEMLGGFAAALAERIADSAVSGVDPTAAGVAVVALIERFHYYVIAGQVRMDDDVMLDTLATITFAALFGAGAQHRP
jgi:AcrR family transcriptional regulator